MTDMTVRRGNTPEDRDGLLRAVALAEADRRGDHLAIAALAPELDDETAGLVGGLLAVLATIATADPDGYAVVLDALRLANVSDG